MKPRTLSFLCLPIAIALMATLSAGPSRADLDGDEPENGPRKVLTYALCAASIVVATTTGNLVLAVLGCSRLFVDEAHDTPGEYA